VADTPGATCHGVGGVVEITWLLPLLLLLLVLLLLG
jgi:hypothetical protein